MNFSDKYICELFLLSLVNLVWIHSIVETIVNAVCFSSG